MRDHLQLLLPKLARAPHQTGFATTTLFISGAPQTVNLFHLPLFASLLQHLLQNVNICLSRKPLLSSVTLFQFPAVCILLPAFSKCIKYHEKRHSKLTNSGTTSPFVSGRRQKKRKREKTESVKVTPRQIIKMDDKANCFRHAMNLQMHQSAPLCVIRDRSIMRL